MRDPYIDFDYYDKEFEGESVKDSDFSKLSKRASDVVDQLTGYKIAKSGLNSYDQFIQGLVKQATAAQVEYYQLEGIETDSTGQTESNGGFSIGKFSVSGGSTSTSRQSARVAPNAIAYLEATGLTKRNGVRIGAI